MSKDMQKPGLSEHGFENVEERDSWLHDYFPGREPTSFPGVYLTPDGYELNVSHLTVSVFPPRPGDIEPSKAEGGSR